MKITDNKSEQSREVHLERKSKELLQLGRVPRQGCHWLVFVQWLILLQGRNFR
jgi:hypothetical protein